MARATSGSIPYDRSLDDGNGQSSPPSHPSDLRLGATPDWTALGGGAGCGGCLGDGPVVADGPAGRSALPPVKLPRGQRRSRRYTQINSSAPTRVAFTAASAGYLDVNTVIQRRVAGPALLPETEMRALSDEKRMHSWFLVPESPLRSDGRAPAELSTPIQVVPRTLPTLIRTLPTRLVIIPRTFATKLIAGI